MGPCITYIKVPSTPVLGARVPACCCGEGGVTDNNPHYRSLIWSQIECRSHRSLGEPAGSGVGKGPDHPDQYIGIDSPDRGSSSVVEKGGETFKIS